MSGACIGMERPRMRFVGRLVLLYAVALAAGVAAPGYAEDRPDDRLVALVRALDERLTVWKRPDGNVVHVSHCRRSRRGCRARLVTFARMIVETANEHDVDPFLIAAMAMRESGFDPFASGAAGERGLVQLHPRGVGARVRFVRSESYRRYCTHQPGACQREVLEVGVELIAKSIEACGDVATGLGMYNSGECGENAYARRVLAEHEKLMQLVGDSSRDDRALMVD